MMQTLKRNWLVVSKLAWWIWRILTRAIKSLKIFRFNGIHLSKECIAWAKKLQRSYLSGQWSGPQLWREIDLSFQNWYEEFDKFWPEDSKVSPIFTLMSSSWKKYMFELKKYRGLISHEIKEWCKTWRKTDRCFGNDMRNLTNFNQSTWKSQSWDFDGILLFKAENIRA